MDVVGLPIPSWKIPGNWGQSLGIAHFGKGMKKKVNIYTVLAAIRANLHPNRRGSFICIYKEDMGVCLHF